MNTTKANMLIPLPTMAGSIDAYISSVNRYPMLTAEQEISLATRWINEKDVLAARELVLSHLRLVVAVARSYLGYGIPHSDLIQEGNIGLMKAVKRFDPTRGVRLVSFALYWIKAEINEFVLKNWRLVKVATTKAQRKLFFNLRTLKKGLESLTRTEARNMAETLGVKTEDVIEMEQRLTGQDIPFEHQDDQEDVRKSPDEYLADTHYEPCRMLERSQHVQARQDGLTNALAALDPRSRRVIETRWLREDKQLTLQELADEFNVSAERIRQIEKKAFLKMREMMENDA